MAPRRSKFPSLAILLMLILLGGITLLVGGLVYLIPQQAEAAFGTPSTNLSSLQRLQYSLQLVIKSKALTQPIDLKGKERPFDIQLGESVGSIAERLAKEGLISDPDALRVYLIYTGLDTRLQAGSYTLSPATSPIQIAQALQDATPHEVPFGVLPGWRLEEIAAALPTSGLTVSPEDFLAAARNPQLAPSLSIEFPQGASLEGFLFPGSYTFRRDISAGEMVLAMVEQFNIHVDAELRQELTRHGLNLYQAVTLASIVQREAMVVEEQATIASVFYNRLSQGMKLDSDPTVQYAIGYNQGSRTWWTNPLSSQDLQVGSQYNTYIYPGLPPGPIDNPGLPALSAVAKPDDTPYLYFRARCDGSHQHLFAETYDEHLQNACQ
ncbi:MAG: endolytic transglycosylase MltG [Anaerolineaceae bacterium]|nr:endolytic transglycosylase MltG [Anaerolineaceae bacterium]